MSRRESHYAQDTELKTIELPLLLKQQARILFGMTGRQLLLIICGLAISFSLWEYFSPLQESVGMLLLGCFCSIPTALSALFAFLLVGTRSLGEWLFILFVWMLTPERIAQKRQFLRTFFKIRTVHTDIVSLDLGKHLEYQAILKIEGKDFDLMSMHEQLTMIEAFKKLLNGLSYPISIHIRMLPYTPTLCSTTNVPEHPVKALRRFYAHYLFFLSQLVVSRPPMCVSYYLTVPADELEEKDETRRLELANVQITSRIQEITRQLARANLSCQRLQHRELLTFYQESFLQEEFPIDQDALINSELFELLAPRSIAIRATRLEIEGKYATCLALTHLPRNTYPGWIHHLIKANEPHVDISIYVQPYASDLMAMQLRRKAVELGGVLLAADKQGDKRGNTITRHALKDIEKVRDKLIRKDTHIFAVTLLLLIHGSSYDELNERVKRVQLILRSLDFQASPLHFQHHLGYFSSLYGHNMLHRYSHLLPTEAVATFYPFLNVPMLEDGILLGATGGNLVSMNPFSKEKLNTNLAVLGVPGSGKSFFLKVMLSRLAPSTAISIIDIEGEYTRWTQAIGARRVAFSADSLHINPLELPGTHERALPQKNVLREKITSLVGFFALLIGDNGTLTQHEKTIISTNLIDTYAAYGITSDPATHKFTPPSLSDFFLQLKRQEPDSDLWHRLTPYLHLFPQKTQVSFDCQHMVYDLQQLPEALRPGTIYLITEKLWHALQENRQLNEQGESTRHLVVIDEAWFLSKFEYGAILLNEFARRIRKYGGAIWAGTQQMGDLLGTEQGKSLLSLCETKVLFKQDITSVNAVASQLHLNQAQINFLKTARQGEALYLTSRDTLAVEILASEQEAAMARTEGHLQSQK